MRPSAFFGMLACAVAVGAIVVGRFLVLPELAASHDLIDANLAKTLAAPIHLRIGEVVLAASLVTAALAGRWLKVGWASTVAIVAVAASATLRFALLPAMYSAWSKADLVAGRPVEHILEAQRLETQEFVLACSIALLHAVLLFAASLTKQSVGEATASPAPAAQPPTARLPVPTMAGATPIQA